MLPGASIRIRIQKGDIRSPFFNFGKSVIYFINITRLGLLNKKFKLNFNTLSKIL